MREADPALPVWLDGALVAGHEARIAVGSAAFQHGLGVFETLAVRDGRLLDLDAHLLRLDDGCEAIGRERPPRTELAGAARAIACAMHAPVGWLKIVAGRPWPLAVFGGPARESEIQAPVSAILLRWRRHSRDPLAGLKSLNYAPFVLGLEHAAREGADDGLWRNERGHLVSSCSGNLFVVRRRGLFTASTRDGARAGVIREVVLAGARELGLSVHEGKLRTKRLAEADEAFLTSSVRGVRPLIRYEGCPVGRGVPGPVTRALTEWVGARRVVDGHCEEQSP